VEGLAVLALVVQRAERGQVRALGPRRDREHVREAEGAKAMLQPGLVYGTQKLLLGLAGSGDGGKRRQERTRGEPGEGRRAGRDASRCPATNRRLVHSAPPWPCEMRRDGAQTRHRHRLPVSLVPRRGVPTPWRRQPTPDRPPGPKAFSGSARLVACFLAHRLLSLQEFGPRCSTRP